MITDRDVNKIIVAMGKVFSTKEDLMMLETRLEKKFITKDEFQQEIKQMEIRFEKKFVTKEEMNDYFNALIKEFLKLNLKVDKLYQEMRVHRIIAGEFEACLTALEQNPS